MAFEVGSATVRLKGDTVDFDKALDRANGKLNSFGSGLGKIGGAITTVGKQAAVMTAAVGTGLFAIGAVALKQASDIEQLRIGFGNFIKDGEELNKVLKNIKEDAVVSTMFGFKDLAKANLLLVSTGESAEKAREVVNSLGDAVAATGGGAAEFNRLATNMQQIRAVGQATALDVKQFAYAGIPIYTLLGNKAEKLTTVLGQNTEAFKEADEIVAKTNPRLEIARKRLQEMKDAGDEGTSSFMRQQLQVTEMEQKVAGASQKMGDLLGKSIEVTGAGKDTIATYEDITEALKNATTGEGMFAGARVAASQSLLGQWEGLKDKIMLGLGDMMVESGLFTGIKDGLYWLGQGVDVVIPKLTQLGKIIGGIFQVIKTGDLTGDFLRALQIEEDGKTAAFLMKLHEAFVAVSTWISNNQDVVMSFLKGLGVALGALLIIGSITLAITALTNPLVLVAAAITALFMVWDQNMFGIQEKTRVVFDWIMAFFQNDVMPTIQVFVDWFNANWWWIKETLQFVWDLIVGLVKYNWAILEGIIKAGLALLRGDWKGAWEAIKTSLGKQWDAIKGIFNTIVDFIGQWGGRVFSKLVEPFQNAFNKAKELWEGMKDFVDPNQRHSPSMVDRVKKGVRDLNAAYEKLNFAPVVNRPTTVNTPQSTDNQFVGVHINLEGAIIADNLSAQRMSEMIGDNIVRRLQTNLRV